MTTPQPDADALIDPELRTLAAQLPAVAFTRGTLPAIRTAIGDLLVGGPPPALDGVLVEEQRIERLDGSALRLLHYRPAAAAASPLPAILHVHGGGFVLGLPEMNHAGNVALARDLECHIVSVDYRLAPEYPYPAGLDDCTSALDWLFAKAAGLGIDPARVGVKGESAGGGLAAALALRDRDRGGDRIAFQHLIYPMLDDRTGVAEAEPGFAGTVGWSPDNNRFAWACLLDGHDGAAVPPYAAPARAERLNGLPATYLSVGALDLFFAEDVAFAGRLRDAGVPVELHVYPGAFHGFEGAADARVARQAVADSERALARALHG